MVLQYAEIKEVFPNFIDTPMDFYPPEENYYSDSPEEIPLPLQRVTPEDNLELPKEKEPGFFAKIKNYFSKVWILIKKIKLYYNNRNDATTTSQIVQEKIEEKKKTR
jgi:hypothetical protein